MMGASQHLVLIFASQIFKEALEHDFSTKSQRREVKEGEMLTSQSRGRWCGCDFHLGEGKPSHRVLLLPILVPITPFFAHVGEDIKDI